MEEIKKLVKPYFTKWQTEVEITAVLKCIADHVETPYEFWWYHSNEFYLIEHAKNEVESHTFPNKPLTLYTEQEEKDLLEILTKLKNA